MTYCSVCSDQNSLYHYGRLGMKWGKHIFQKDKTGSGTKQKTIQKPDLRSNDYVVKKGSTVSRISTKQIENVKDARKYVSLTQESEQKWKDLFLRGRDFVYEHRYKTVKDLKVSSIDKNIEEFTKMILNDPDFTRQVAESINYHEWATGARRTGNFTDDFFRSLAMRTEASGKYFDKMSSKGYDAIADKYGIETGADQSVIVLHPDKTLKLKSSKLIKK